MILKEATGGRSGRDAVLAGGRKRQYDLSDETWAGAVAELEDVGLVGVEVVFAKSTERDDFETKRRRLRYTLADDSALEV